MKLINLNQILYSETISKTHVDWFNKIYNKKILNKLKNYKFDYYFFGSFFSVEIKNANFYQ